MVPLQTDPDVILEEEPVEKSASPNWWTGLDAKSAAWAAIGVGGVLLFASRMLMVVRDSGLLQYNDYWPIMGDLLRSDGSPRFGEFFEFRNEHPIVVAKVLYWLNAQLFAGSNETLGFVVVAIVLAQVVVLAVLALRTLPAAATVRVAFTIAASALLFAPQGAWNFYKAMSGSAWLSANLFALLALWLQHRRCRWLAVAMAVLASMSYGTGLLVWPALAVAGAVHDRRTRPRPEYVAGFLVTGVWHMWARNGENTAFIESVARGRFEGSAYSPGYLGRVRVAAELVGSIGVGPSELIGWFVIMSGLGLVVWAARSRPELAPWVGFVVFGLGGVVLMAFGRGLVLELFGTQSRYASLSALIAIGWLALAISWAREKSEAWQRRPSSFDAATSALLCVTLGAWSYFGGAQPMIDRKEGLATQAQLRSLFLLDLADGAKVSLLAELIPPITDRLQTMGHFPFDGRGLACGQGGDVAPVVNGLPLVVNSIGTPTEISAAPGASQYTVEVPRGGSPVDCLIVVDASRRIVGLGSRVSGSDPSASTAGFTVVVRTAADSPQLLATDGDVIRLVTE